MNTDHLQEIRTIAQKLTPTEKALLAEWLRAEAELDRLRGPERGGPDDR